MKIAGARVESFVRKPDPNATAILVFGPDRGLVRERADALARTAVEQLSDPFRVAELAANAIQSDPALLHDEAAAFCLTGGRRLVRIRDVGDALAPAFESFLAGPPRDGALVVIEAGDLGKRSALRRVFEEAANGAAIACYPDDERTLPRLIEEALAAHRLSADRDALSLLIARLGADRAHTRAEIEKLALYKGEAGTVTVEDVAAAVGDSGPASLDTLVYAMGDGDLEELDRALARVLGEGATSVAVIRAALRHIDRLHQARALAAEGGSADQAMGRLRPPVIFKWAAPFRRQMASWSDSALAGALDLLLEAELDCKTTGLPADAISARALMRVSQAARRARREHVD